MATTAVSIIQRAVTILQDVTNLRWSAKELVQWLNDGQREIAVYRPDLFAQTLQISMAAGTRQTLPATAFKLIGVVNNVTSKNAVTMVERGAMDEMIPGWHAATAATDVRHYMYDIRDPRTFYVYPPAPASGAAVNAVCAVYPVDITEPADGASYTTVTGNLSVIDLVASALVDYLMFRAFAKDAEYAGNAARATAHYSAFTNLIGVEISATSVSAPGVNRAGKPA